MEKRTVHILENVKKLYSRYGIKSVTMDDVARQLCISKKTLYEHFKDKEELVKSILLLDHQTRLEAHRGLLLQNLNAVEELFEVYRMTRSRFRDYNPSMEYDIRKYYPDLYKIIRGIRREAMFEVFGENLKKGKREGMYRRDLDTLVIAKLLVFQVENLSDNDLFSIDELISSRVFHELLVYHLHGILSPKGLVFFRNYLRKTPSLID